MLPPNEVSRNGELHSGEQDNTFPGLGIQTKPGHVRPHVLARTELLPPNEVSRNGELHFGEQDNTFPGLGMKTKPGHVRPHFSARNELLPPKEVSRNGELEYGPQDNPFLRCDIRKISWGGAMLIISEMAEGDKTERRDDRRRV